METDVALEVYLRDIKGIIHLMSTNQMDKVKEKLRRANEPLRIAILEDYVRDKCLLLFETMEEYTYGIPPARLEDVVNDFHALVFSLPDDTKRRILSTKR